MKSIVWDFDDTIANSYPGIVAATQKSLRENFDISLSKDTIFKEAKKTSVRKLAADLLKDQPDPDKAVDTFYKTYFLYEKQYHDKITLMPHIMDVLQHFDNEHYIQFIITHRDQSIFDLSKSLGIEYFFKEIVSVADDHERKPNSEMIEYLMKKYDLKSEDIWVIGDRQIDVDFGNSVGAHTILYNADDVDFKYENKVGDLLDIEKLI